MRNETCSHSCSQIKRNAVSKMPGICHAASANAAASQQTTGCVATLASPLTGNRADDEANHPLRQPAQDWQSGPTEQDQRWREAHEQQVLHHMNRKRDIVEGFYG